MKLRVKSSGTWSTVEVADNDQCTLSQLRQQVAHVLQLGQRSFELSLNSRDALSGEDQTLSQLGLVHGDMLFLLCDHYCLAVNNNASDRNNINNNAGVRTSGTPPSSSSTSCTSASSVGEASDSAQLLSSSVTVSGVDLEDADADNGAELTEQSAGARSGGEGLHEAQVMLSETETETCCIASPGKETETHCVQTQAHGQSTTVSELTNGGLEYSGEADNEGGEDTERLSPCPLEDPEVNRCLQEPLLCRESTLRSVPAVLRDVYTTATCSTTADALWVVVHTLMMEVGFRPVQQADILLVADWNTRGFYRQEYYHLCVNTQHTYSIMGVVMGPILIVHGASSVDPAVKTDRQHLKISQYVYNTSPDVTSVYRNLERLSRTVKDLICQPLLSHLSEVCGFPVSLGLLSLSYEVKLKVLSYLPASSLVAMGQVCTEYNATYKDPCLWRRLHLREFGRSGDNSLNKDWYSLYKEEYQLRKERRKLTGRRHPALTGIPPWLTPGHFPPLRPLPYTGGFLGGDYDINPEFASGIPHPLFSNPTGPNPFQPLGPLGQADPGNPFQPRPRFPDPSAPGSFPGPPFMSLGGGASSAPRPSPVVSLGGRVSRSPRPSPFQSLGGNRFL